MALETTACDLCGSTDARPRMCVHDRMYGIPGEFQLVRCQSCGLLYINPRPDKASIGAFYPGLDYHAFKPSTGPKAKLMSWLHGREASTLLAGLPRGACVFEIGCGTGDLLAALRDRGAAVQGIEPNPSAAQAARNRYGLAVETGILDDVPLEPSTFDLIVMKYALEHVHSPHATLKRIGDLLRPGGRAVFWVPNAKSLDALLFGACWRGLDAPRHLYIFTPKTVRGLLDSAGLRVEMISYSPMPNDWAGSVEFWLRDHGFPEGLAHPFGVSSPLAMFGWLPISTLAALFRAAGRMRVTATKER
jgi:SAM-dependent methyltransferase